MKKKCVAIIVLLGCCLFVTAYTKGEAKNAQADYMVSETDDGSETFETDHGFYTDADDVERAENEPQNGHVECGRWCIRGNRNRPWLLYRNR